jgi:hypothetical protein
MSTNKENTQLTPAIGYNTSRMIFSDPQDGTIPGSTPSIKFKRINIRTKNEDGTIGDLIISTERVFSFGVQENKSLETGEVSGHVMPLCLWNKEGATSGEEEWIRSFNKIIDNCKKHVIDNREEIGQYDLEMSHLYKFNPLYWKKDKGKVVDGQGPVLYAKLIESKKQNKILTMFYDTDGNPIPDSEIHGKYCHANAAIKIESIFIGNKISMQVKLWEAEVEFAGSRMKRLRKQRPDAERRVLGKPTSNSGAPFGDDAGDSDGTGSLDDQESDPVPAPVKRVIRKVKKVTGKKA